MLEKIQMMTPVSVKRTIQAIQLSINMPMARLRSLPDFIIIGGQKCGTTSLYHYLKKHPSIIAPLRKEIRFFDINFSKTLKWYRAHFPMLWYKMYISKINQKSSTFEASPDYMFYPQVPKRIKNTIPHVKLIVLLRNPVDRAYSHYYHEIRHGTEKELSFEDAILTVRLFLTRINKIYSGSKPNKIKSIYNLLNGIDQVGINQK